MKCNVCACNIRQTTYELHYIGTVCSKCFRMSKKKYCELVEIISILKVKYIFDEIFKKALNKKTSEQSLID